MHVDRQGAEVAAAVVAMDTEAEAVVLHSSQCGLISKTIQILFLYYYYYQVHTELYKLLKNKNKEN